MRALAAIVFDKSPQPRLLVVAARHDANARRVYVNNAAHHRGPNLDSGSYHGDRCIRDSHHRAAAAQKRNQLRRIRLLGDRAKNKSVLYLRSQRCQRRAQHVSQTAGFENDAAQLGKHRCGSVGIGNASGCPACSP